MTDVSIRPATVEDADALAAVYRSAYRANRELGFPAAAGSATADTVASWIREYRVHVAERGGDLGGGVRVERTGPDRVKVGRFGVREADKGEGIGTALLEHVEDRARARGDAAVWLTTPGEHPTLPDFYRRRGYVETGDYPLDHRDYDEIVMEKHLG